MSPYLYLDDIQPVVWDVRPFAHASGNVLERFIEVVIICHEVIFFVN